MFKKMSKGRSLMLSESFCLKLPTDLISLEKGPEKIRKEPGP